MWAIYILAVIVVLLGVLFNAPKFKWVIRRFTMQDLLLTMTLGAIFVGVAALWFGLHQ